MEDREYPIVQSVLITGVSSGIGAAAARELTNRGFRVFGASRSEPDTSCEAEWVCMDVCDEKSVRDGVAQMLARAGNIDALVCSAGYGIFGSVEEVSIDLARQQFDTNYFGTLRCLRAVLPHMRAAKRGRIALLGSLSGRAPIPFQSHYSSSKAAIDALVMSLRNELHPHRVQVSLIEPGDINTPFNAAMDWSQGADSAYGEMPRNCEEVVRESLPKAPGPEVVARAIATALTTRRPRVRYAVGADSRLVPLGRRLLPDWLSLRLIRSHFGI